MQVKIAVTGHGTSDKSQIIKMLPLLVEMSRKTDKKDNKKDTEKDRKKNNSVDNRKNHEKIQDDEYDAIAVALTCIAHQGKSFPQVG